jgi:hypothetical protein
MFAKRCEGLSVCDVSNDRISAKLITHSLQGEAKNWVVKWHNKILWSIIRSAFVGNFGEPKITDGMKREIMSFKQR